MADKWVDVDNNDWVDVQPKDTLKTMPFLPKITERNRIEHPYKSAFRQMGQDAATIPAHALNQLFLDYPRRLSEQFGYEYPSKTDNPYVQPFAYTAGFLGGLKNPIFKALGVTPASSMGTKMLGGGLTGATYAPSKFESPEQVITEQAGKAAFGAFLPPAIEKGIPSVTGGLQTVTGGLQKFGRFSLSKAGGLSRDTMNTIDRLGYKRIKNIANQGATYIQQQVIPKAKQVLLKNITKFSGSSKEALEEIGFNPNQIDDMMNISKENIARHGKAFNESFLKTTENLQKAKQTVGKKIGDIYDTAAINGNTINIKNTISTMKKQLQAQGLVDEVGNLMGDYKTHPSSAIRNMAQLYADYARRIGKTGDISIADFRNFRSRLDASVVKGIENEKFNVPLYITRKTLDKDSVESLAPLTSLKNINWRGLNKEYSDLINLEILSKKINTVVNKLPEKLSTQRTKLTDKHLRIYGQDIIDDVKAFNAARELYPNKETLGLFNLQKPVARGIVKGGQIIKEGVKPFTDPLYQRARQLGQFGMRTLQNIMDEPYFSPATKAKLKSKGGFADFESSKPPSSDPEYNKVFKKADKIEKLQGYKASFERMGKTAEADKIQKIIDTKYPWTAADENRLYSGPLPQASKEVMSTLEKAGVKFKGMTKPGEFYEEEGVWFDGPNGSTFSLPMSKFSIDAVKSKLNQIKSNFGKMK